MREAIGHFLNGTQIGELANVRSWRPGQLGCTLHTARARPLRHGRTAGRPAVGWFTRGGRKVRGDEAGVRGLSSKRAGLGTKSARRKKEEVNPDLVHFLMTLGLLEDSIPGLIERAQKWWHEVGSYRSGKLAFAVEDFGKKQAETVLTFLLSKGVPISELGEIVTTCPQILKAEVQDDLAPIVRLLEGLNLTGKPLVGVLVHNPSLLLTGDWKAIASIVEILKRLQLHESKIKQIVARDPHLLSLSLSQLQENTNLLADLILMEEDLLMFIVIQPDVLSRPAKLLKNVEAVLSKVGVTAEETKGCIQAVPNIFTSPPHKTEERINALLNGGMNRKQIAKLIKSYPKVLLRSVSSIKSKMEFLSRSAGRNVTEILDFPLFFDFSLTNRIGPRLVFLKLRNPNAFRTTKLQQIINCTNKKFAEVVAKQLLEDYIVFREQWSKLYNAKIKSAS